MNATRHPSRSLDYIAHMFEATRLARSYVKAMNKDAFLADRKTQQAVMLNLVVIGEAASQLVEVHPDFALRHSEIPWTKIRGMRNRMAHGYFNVNLDIVWDTVQQDLPDLEAQLVRIE